MSNPFDDERGEFRVLVNAEGQHSLWPQALDIPQGWELTGAAGDRSVCLAWIEANWTDMRPKSLVAAMSSGS